MDELRQAITELVGRYIPTDEARAALADPDAELAALGVESLAIVELIVLLETRFAISFPSDLLDRSTFRTVASIAEAVMALRDPGGDAGPDLTLVGPEQDSGNPDRAHSPNRIG